MAYHFGPPSLVVDIFDGCNAVKDCCVVYQHIGMAVLALDFLKQGCYTCWVCNVCRYNQSFNLGKLLVETSGNLFEFTFVTGYEYNGFRSRGSERLYESLFVRSAESNDIVSAAGRKCSVLLLRLNLGLRL
jgi:hypothetical protein